MKGIILQLSTGKEISYRAWDNELLQDLTYFVNIDAASNVEVKEKDEVTFEFITVDRKTTGIITGIVKDKKPMKLIIDFGYYQTPKDDEPRLIEIDNPVYVANKGDTIWYEFEDNSGEIPYSVEDKCFKYRGTELIQITLTVKEI